MAESKEKLEMGTTRTESMESSKRPGESELVEPIVNFSLWQTLGMNFSISCAPLTIGAYLALVIGLGGSPFYIWGFLFAAIFQLVTCVALAEIASAMPHSSGMSIGNSHG
jgi:amino acid transporter